jgi:hypothetical protein
METVSMSYEELDRVGVIERLHRNDLQYGSRTTYRRIELEDLAYHEQLLERRRASGVQAVVDEVLRNP